MDAKLIQIISACMLTMTGMGQSSLAAEIVLTHGHIYTGDSQRPWVEALAINRGQIEAVGSTAAMRSHRTSRTKVIDLQGKTVLPGIIDSHLHLLWGAMILNGFRMADEQIDLKSNPDLFAQRIHSYAASHPQDKAIIGVVDFGTIYPNYPSLELLDRLVPDRPALIFNSNFHSLWANSKAMALAGVTDQPLLDSAQERGVVREANGRPIGIFLEAAEGVIVEPVVREIPLEDKLAAIKAAARHLNALGITSVVNASGTLSEIELYGKLRDRGELTVRTRTSFAIPGMPHHLTAAFLADLEAARARYQDDWVSANLVKFFVDGSSGAEPILLYQADEFRKLVIELDRRGFQLMSHALRPDSVRFVLDTYSTLDTINGKRDRRHRVEHASMVSDADIGRFKSLGVVASMQPNFCCSPGGLWWPTPDVSVTDRWNTLEKTGASLAFGSDFPFIWPGNPLSGIQSAVTRQVWERHPGFEPMGAEQGGATAVPGAVYAPEEKLTVKQAVDAYTRGSAYAAFFDHAGTLAPGKLADLVVLSNDIFSMPPETINTARVMMTIVAGKIVFGEPPAAR